MWSVDTELLDHIKEIVPEKDILQNEPMAGHTTLRVGGPAKLFVNISDEDQLTALIPYLKGIGERYFVKGCGSNLLVSDKGYDGVILQIGDEFSGITVSGDIIEADSGARMSAIAMEALRSSLTGFEFASGIPGTIGGGTVMNAGAYDGELKDVIVSVSVIDEKGEKTELDNSDMEFGYRKSILLDRPFAVTHVKIRLKPGDEAAIKNRMSELNEKRRDKQPLEYPSAGSTFKRPEGYFAGKLIMDAGLRGYSIGGASVSEKHCGFVINKGDATASDVYDLINKIRETVRDKFSVELEPEVIFLGEF